MAAAMNGLALHGGIVPYGGTFLVFTDYCRPAIRLSALMGQRVDLCHDAQLDRARRGRPHAPAGRASGGAARHPQPQRVPARRPDRDGGMLGAGAAGGRHAVDPGSDAPGGAGAAQGRQREPMRQGRLCAGRDGRRDARRDDPGDRLGGRRRHGGARAPGQGRHQGRSRVDAVLGTVRGASPLPIARRCWARRRALPSRRPSSSAGSAGSARAASSSACRASVHRRRRPSSTSTSASRRTKSRTLPGSLRSADGSRQAQDHGRHRREGQARAGARRSQRAGEGRQSHATRRGSSAWCRACAISPGAAPR